MIEKIKISNFKSIEELELDLGRINVLIGENGCGKTNILEAIAFASIKTIENFSQIQKGVRETELKNLLFKGREDIPRTIKFELIDQSSQRINISCNYNTSQSKFGLNYNGEYYEGGLNTSIGVQKNAIESWTNANFSEEKLDETDRKFIQLSRNILKFEEANFLNGFAIFTPENSFLKRFDDENYLKPLGVSGQGLLKELGRISLIHPEKYRKIKEGLEALDWFQDLDLLDDLSGFVKRLIIKDRFMGGHREMQYLDQRSANEGFLFLLFYFTLFVSDDTPKFFAIDNIDQALNPKLCIKLMQTLTEMANKHNKQVIFTTHNPSILDGLDLKDDQQRLFVVYRNTDGNTVAKRHIRKEGLPGVEPVRLSEAFIRGYLGGLPKNF